MQKIWYIACALVIVLAAAGFLGWYFLTPEPKALATEELVITSGSPEFSALTQVAYTKGFFTRHGLNVTIREYPSGVGAVDDMMAGNADLAYAAEFVGVSLISRYPDLRILGSTAKCDVISLVARSDRGIASSMDLRGKSVAAPKNTQAEFFLGRYLMLNGINRTDVTIRYLAPADLVQSVVSGESDAAIIWEPYVYTIEQQLGDRSRTFPAQNGQRFYWLTYTRPEVLENRGDVLVRYFRALSDAEQYVYRNEDESRAIIKKRVNLSEGYVSSLWKKNQYVLSFDQSLIIAMEDESRWMIDNNVTVSKTVPNYLEYISTDSLRRVSPASVNIIS